MPGFTPQVGDVLQIRVYCGASNQLSENVLHYRVESVVGGGVQLDSIALLFETRVHADYKAWMPLFAEWLGLTAQNITPPITNPAIANLQAGVGTALGGLAPHQVSGLISTSTAFGGRNQKGRVFIGFPTVNWLTTAGELGPAAVAQLATIASLIGSLVVISLGGASASLRLLVRHPDLPGPPRIPTGSPVTGLSASTGIATQRRRGDFGAPNTPFPV